MLDPIAPPSPGAAAEGSAPSGNGDGKTGNVSVEQMTARLAARMRGETTPAAIPPAATIAAPAPAEVNPAAPGTAQAAPVTAPVTPAPAPLVEAPADAPEVITQPDLSQLSDLDPRTQERVKQLVEAQKQRTQEAIDKRIGKEVGRRKALEEQLAKLQGTQPVPPQPLQSPFQQPVPQQAQPIQQVQAPIQVPVSIPLPGIDTVQALQAKQHEARLVRQNVEDAIALGPNADGKFTVNGQEYSRQDVIDIRRGATDMLENQIPQKYQFIQTRQQALATAVQTFPWMSNSQSPEYQQASALINQNPWLRNLPSMEYTVGMFIEGLKAVGTRAQATPAAPAAAARVRPPGDQSVIGGGGSAPTRTNGDALAKQALTEQIGKLRKKGGVSVNEYAAHLAQRETLSNSR